MSTAGSTARAQARGTRGSEGLRGVASEVARALPRGQIQVQRQKATPEGPTSGWPKKKRQCCTERRVDIDIA